MMKRLFFAIILLIGMGVGVQAQNANQVLTDTTRVLRVAPSEPSVDVLSISVPPPGTYCASTASIPPITTCYRLGEDGEFQVINPKVLSPHAETDVFSFVVPVQQAPTKLFDVANGNGAVVSGVTVQRGTIIWYRDNEAKNKVMQMFADAYGYQATIPNPAFDASKPEDPVTNPATIPNPQGQQAFFNKQISNYIRDVVKGQIVKAAAETAAKAAADAEEADLPTRTVKP